MSSLAHHGVKGQKWGVRRYQNPDGTRTALGKKQLKAIRLSRNEEGIRQVYRSLSDKDLNLLGYEKEEIEANRKDDFKDLGRRHTDYDQYNRVRYKNGDAVGYIAATGYQTAVGRGKKIVNILAIDLAVNSNYRGQGHSVELGKDIVRWFDRYGSKEYDRMEWYAKAENIASQKAAERSGFERRSKKESAQGWVKYAYQSQNQKQFKEATQQVNSKLSTNAKPIKKEPADIHGVMDRAKCSEKDARTCIALADKLYDKAASSEPRITKDILGIVNKGNSSMYGLEHRLKQPTSMAGKIGSDATSDGVSFEEASRGIKDAIRYTTVSSNKTFVSDYNKFKQGLESKGYEEVKCKNFFEKYRAGEVKHKAVQTTFKSPTGYEFEVQFQTPESQAAKELKIPIYEERRKQGISSSRAKELEKQMEDLAERVPYPEGIETIPSHNKLKHSSIGGNMNYIYGNTLVLGDSSYLEHHGIKNQKWGIRRFQNPDGSLTAAGRIRYGVTGAAKAAFKVGKKLGAATASAVRAGVKKSKDTAYAKKKEKASQTREGVLKNKKMFTNEELKRLEERFKIEDDMRNAGLRHGQEIAKTISAYGDAAVKTMNAIQTGGKAVKAVSDGLSALQDYKEKRDIGKKASDAGTKAKTSEKTSNKPPNDDNPPNDGGGGGSKKQVENEAKRQAAQEAIYAKRKADLDSRESGLKQREDYVNKRYDALLKVSKQRQSEQDARDEDLNRRDKAASEREAKLKETEKTAADVMRKLNKRKADLDKKESFLNSIESYRLDTLSEFKKNEEEAARRKKKNARHSAIGEEMYTDHLEHHGIKGQRWGVRRFQNADGSLTDKGRKHYQKKLALEERKLTAANAARGRYERVRTPLSVGMGVVGAVAGAMAGVPAGPAGIAAGAAFVSSIAASSTYAEYTLKGVFAGHGANRSKKKIAKYKEALAQDAFEIQNGVLIYGSDRSGELKHFGLKGMKWGVRRFQDKDGSLTDAGKKRYSNTGELDGGGGGGGGAPEEEDEETKKAIEEAAKKAGMTVDEYRKKFADKVTALKEKARDASKEVADTVYNEAGGKYKKAAAENNAAANRALREAAAKDMKAKESYHDYERLNERGAKMAASWAKSSAESYEKSADNSRYAHRMYKKNQAEANKRYEESLAGRVEATSRKIGTKAQEAKDKLKSRAPKRSIALEVTNTGPAPVGQTEIHTADLYNKYFGAVARARKTAANSTAAQRAKYGDRRNIRERAEAEELNNARAREKRDEAIRLRMAKKFDKKADSARAHGNTAKAKAFEKESNRQFNKAPISGSKAEAFEAARDATLASHLVRNAATAKRAQSATLAENRNRNAANLAERRRERSINEAKAKIRSGNLPVNELTRYAKSSVGQLKSAAKAELARREKEQALASMGSDYARATARVTTTSSTTNTTDAHNEKLARDRRDKRKQAAKVSATAKKNRLAGSGRKKYNSGQTSSIGRVGSGRGKTSTRR